jgi:flavin reductase (DIM6/NTAB) family NADH-FMN oxidoreductase RutF
MTKTVDATVPEQLAKDLREAHKLYPTGVTIVTVQDGGAPKGLAVNAFTSVSYNPPAVLVCINQTSSSYPPLFKASHYGINILASDQKSVAGVFASKSTDKFADLEWTPAEQGSPQLAGAAAFFEVRIDYRLPVYTHTILVGEIVAASYDEGASPLVFRGGKFYDGAQLVPLEEG